MNADSGTSIWSRQIEYLVRFLTTSWETAGEQCLQNDGFCAERDVKHLNSINSTNPLQGHINGSARGAAAQARSFGESVIGGSGKKQLVSASYLVI